MPRKKAAHPTAEVLPSDGQPPETTEHDDACRCEGCVNSNYPRSRTVILAELTAAAREHGCLWVLEFVMPQQLEMFR